MWEIMWGLETEAFWLLYLACWRYIYCPCYYLHCINLFYLFGFWDALGTDSFDTPCGDWRGRWGAAHWRCFVVVNKEVGVEGEVRWNERERCFFSGLVFLFGDWRAILFRDRDGWKESVRRWRFRIMPIAVRLNCVSIASQLLFWRKRLGIPVICL